MIQDNSPIKILLLAANPKGSTPLQLGTEEREIDNGLRRSRYRHLISLAQRWAVRPPDLRQALLDEEPQIVHFSGHGSRSGLVLEAADGQSQLVDPEAIANLFSLFAGQVRCVLLNACYSENQARAIARHIDYVIGIGGPVSDQAAIEFVTGFYEALGGGRSIEDAYKFGCNAIQLAGYIQNQVPALLVNPSRVPAPRLPQVEPVSPSLPAVIAEKLPVSRPLAPGQQRKQVTVLFADVSGYTAMSETMDPEDVAEIMNALWERLDVVIREQRGWLDKHMGDAVMAIWGVEQAREDDPELAVRAALKMQSALEAFQSEHKVSLAMRIGLHTGLALLGAVGTGGEFSATGDTVNTASRLEHAAPVGGVLISQDTYSQVRGVFNMQTLDPITVKGKVEPIQVYQVKDALPRAFRMDTRGVLGIQIRLVGRDAELKQMQDALLTTIEERQRQSITVIGEAGLGKSRLLLAFENWIADEVAQGALPAQLNYFKGRAFPDSQPYALLRDLFNFRFQIMEDDPLPVAQQKLQAGLTGQLGDDDNGRMKAHFIGQLLGFNFSASPYLRGVLGDGKRLHDQALSFLIEYFRLVLQKAPALILLEDLHWADDSSLDLVGDLRRALPEQPLLVIELARPQFYERRPYWAEGEDGHTHIDLRPLSRRDSQRLVAEILRKAEAVPEKLRDLLTERAEGNPFYLEELVNMLIQDGIILQGEEHWRIDSAHLDAAGVPATLAGVLQARLESLSGEERIVLQQASVIGRTFWESAIVYLNARDSAAGPEEIASRLAALRTRQMILRRDPSAFQQTGEYSFKHALLRDVAYESVLKRVRQAYHTLAAEWLIEQGGDRSEEYLGLIAEHLERAGRDEQAAIYFRQAGKQAAERYANREALQYLSHALALTSESDANLRFALLLECEEIYHLAGSRQEQRRVLQALEKLAQNLQDPRQTCALLLRQARFARFTDDHAPGIAAATQAVEIAARLGNPELESQSRRELGSLLRKQGKYALALQHLQQALTLAQQSGNLWQQGRCIYDIGCIYQDQALYLQASMHLQQALEIYRQIGNQAEEIHSLYMLGTIYAETGDYPASQQAYQQALSLSQAIGLRYITMNSLISLGSNAFDLGDYSAAASYQQQSLPIAQEIGNRYSQAIILDTLSLVHLVLGETGLAETQARQALEIESAIDDRSGQTYTLNHLGLILAKSGNPGGARQAFEQALALRREIEQYPQALDDLAGLARLALEQADLSQAAAYVSEIQQAITQYGIDGCEYPVWVYLTCYQVLKQVGQSEVAQQALQDGRRLLMERADRIQDPALRQQFLENVPFNRDLLKAA